MVHGILLVNKASGGTSHGVIHSLRKILGQKMIGHAGTLDPMAGGLLVVLLGYGTKLSNYLLMNNKRYRFVFQIGVTTDSLDKTGQILSKKKVDLNLDFISKTLKQSQGLLSLPVPLLSAVKVKGKKLYEYKRRNQPIEPPYREMFFYDLEIQSVQSDRVEVSLSCNKGSYIRSWVSFVGDKLGSGACLEKLIRLESHPFTINSSLKIQEIEDKLKEKKELKSSSLQDKLGLAFIPFSKALPHVPSISISSQGEKKIAHGQISNDVKKELEETQKKVNKTREKQMVCVMNCNNKQMLALLELRPFTPVKILRVFPSGLS